MKPGDLVRVVQINSKLNYVSVINSIDNSLDGYIPVGESVVFLGKDDGPWRVSALGEMWIQVFWKGSTWHAFESYVEEIQ